MLTPDQIAALRDRAEQITEPITEFLLEDIARRISEAGQLTSTASYQIWQAQQLGISQREIKKRLKDLLEVSNSEIEQLLTQSAEVGYNFDIRNLPHADAVPFAENAVLQQIVSAAVELAQEDFTNLPQTLGMIDPYGNALPLQDAYRSCTDFAFKQVITGATDYNTAIRRATKNLADQGLLVIDYESGVHTSLEAAVRRNIMGGLGLMQEKISQQNHDDFGCDGWEISAHANSAPDHEPIQGKQYSDVEYINLNNSLVRRIGTLNCGHAAFPIILGGDQPQHTPEELEKLRQDNANGVTVDGKHYTGYEATQMQRKIERAMRREKRRILTAEATGDTEGLSVAQTRLQRLRQEYTRFSDAAGLRTQDERAQVAGFGHKEAARARKAVNLSIPLEGIEKGLGASNQSGSDNKTNEKPSLIGRVDFSDKEKIIQQLNGVEEKLLRLDYEVNVSVTSDGKVWWTSGESSTVHPENIPSSLKGSYSYHNHPDMQTHFSFSNMDAAFFIESGQEYSKASDSKFEYVMRRTKNTIEKTYAEVYDRYNEIFETHVRAMAFDGQIDMDIDEYHEVMKQLSKEMGFEYERKKKG